MSEKAKSDSVARFSTPLARDLFIIGAEAGLMLKKQIDAERQNIVAAKQAEEKTEGRIYPRRQPRDE